MIGKAELRRLSRWLVGLFFVAQICGVVLLLGQHTAHVAESQLILSGATIAGHGHHHGGDADGAVQHHELQDLNGAPACLIVRCEIPLAHFATTAYVPDALTEKNPVVPERPPKHLLTV